jgi:hypothetical protein
MFIGRTKLQVDDPIMDWIYDIVHMDLDMICLLPLHWVSTKLESNLVVTPNDNRFLELDDQLGKEVL